MAAFGPNSYLGPAAQTLGRLAALCALMVLGCISPSVAQTTATVDWNSEFPASDTVFPPDQTAGFVFTEPLTGATATFNREFITDGTASGRAGFAAGSGITIPFGLADFVTYNDFAFGDAGVGNLPLVMDNTSFDQGDRIVFTIDFDRPVTDLTFQVLDIDDGPTSNDAVEVFFDAGGGAFQNIVSAPAVFATGTSVAVSDIPGVTGFEGNAGAVASAAGSLFLDFNAQPVQRIRIEYFVGDNDAAVGDPGTMFVGVGDVSFVVPAVPGTADLSLDVQSASSTPTTGFITFLDVTVSNQGPEPADSVTVDFDLPSGLAFTSDDGAPGEYNDSTGVWTPAAPVPAGGSASLRVFATVEPVGSYLLAGEVLSSSLPDPDSTVNNGIIGEDDDDTLQLVPVAPPPPLLCLGRPITPLVFIGPQGESAGADLTSPDVGDVFRFVNVSPGVDALVEVLGASGSAGLVTVDDDTQGTLENFQPTLLDTTGAEAFVDFRITIVATGTSNVGTLSFAASTVDIDGGGGIREYIEVSNNIVEFAVDGAGPAPNTQIASTIISPPVGTPPIPSPPSAGSRVRFEVATETQAPGDAISTDPDHIATAFFTGVSVFEYRIGKFGVATGAAGRLNSLAFNCPDINPTTTSALALEDFGDAPISFGNPIHVIDAGVLLGASNTDEAGPGDSADASTDAGDDGVTLIGGDDITVLDFDQGETQTLVVSATGAGGFLQAWFDWNVDGDFDDPGEQVAVNVVDEEDDQMISLPVTAPATAVPGTSFARFRWSTEADLTPIEAAGDGEVEDYTFTISGPVLTIQKTASPVSVTENFTTVFTIEVTETAGFDATGLVITDPVPTGFSIVSIANGGTQTGNTITWSLPGALNLSSASVSFTAQAGPVTGNTPITNTASVIGDQFASPLEDSVIVTVLEGPTIITDETFPGLCPNAGGMRGANFFPTAAGGGTFGTGSGAVDEVVSPDPFPGFISPMGYNYVDTGFGDAFGSTIGAHSVISNSSILAFGNGHTGIIDPENGVTGRFIAINGSTENEIVFSQVVDGLTANTNYEYSFWVANLLDLDLVDQPNDPSFELQVDGVPLTSTGGIVETASLTWIRVGGVFNSGESTDVTISLEALNSGSAGNDYLLDNIGVFQCTFPSADLEANKTVSVFDPQGLGLFAVPGNDVIYTITVRNPGPGTTDVDTLFLVDDLPPEVIFFNGDANGPTGAGDDPVIFTETVPGTGLDPFVFANDVRFSDAAVQPDDISECSYTPAAGFDPAVTFVCINPKGVLATGNPVPEFTLEFRTRIR